MLSFTEPVVDADGITVSLSTIFAPPTPNDRSPRINIGSILIVRPFKLGEDKSENSKKGIPTLPRFEG